MKPRRFPWWPWRKAEKTPAGMRGYLEHDVLETIQDENARDSFLAVHFSGLQEIMVQAIEALPDKEKLLISLILL